MTMILTPVEVPLPLELHGPPACVSGFPCVVIMTLRNPASGLPRGGFPIIEAHGAPTHLEIVWRHGERVLARAAAVPPVARESPPPSFSLMPGAARRQLVDLDASLDPVPAGHGVVEIDYRDTGASGRFELAVSDPTDGDRSVLAHRRPGRSWLATLLSQPRVHDSLPHLSSLAKDALALDLAYADAVRAPSLAELDPQRFERSGSGSGSGFGFGPGLAPELAALDYELRVAREDPSRGELREMIERRWPDIVWRLDAVDLGRGALSLLRERHARAPVVER